MITGNPELDFFEQNPELKFKTEFKQLLEKYPKNASKIAWSVYMIEDPNSKFFRMPREERIAEIQKNYYNLDTEEHKHLLDAYGRLALTKEQNMFKIHIDAMDRLTANLKELDVGEDSDHNKLTRVLEKLPKIWDGLEKVKSRMIDADSKTSLRGGASQSAREKRGKNK